MYRWEVYRSIPACAGEPDRTIGRHRRIVVYPRVCGGTGIRIVNIDKISGLSPRVRGNLCLVVSLSVSRRSIPACAGEPATITGLRAGVRVYPRVCGGTRRRPAAGAPGTGLSPRVRGNRAMTNAARGLQRSIPACAGEPAGGSLICAKIGVYPRVCGGTLDA